MLDKKTDREGHRDPCRSEDWIYRRGDIYLANLNPFKGSEQGGTRPVLVLQNNDGNYYCPTLIVAPITTKLKKLNMPSGDWRNLRWFPWNRSRRSTNAGSRSISVK